MEIIKILSQFSIALLELLGVAIITLSAIVSLVTALFSYFGKNTPTYKTIKHKLGKGILLGLEFLVAGDIIRSVAVEPSLTGVLVLGGIVLIRTFLSFTIEIEMSGRLPWMGGTEDKTGY